MIQKTNEAFTLIELLIVIAIIGLLASIVMAALGSARAKGKDALRKQDMQQLKTAIDLYYQNTNTMPVNQNPGYGYPDTSPNFLIELVNTGLISKIPHAPAGSAYPYYYYDYGQGANGVGALVTTTLEVSTPSVTGEQGTCRPFSPNSVGWCEQTVSQWYCLCNAY